MCGSKSSKTAAPSPKHHHHHHHSTTSASASTSSTSASASSSSIAAAVKTLPPLPSLIPFNTIAAATDNFAPSRLIPRASSIYRCTLLNSEAAVSARPLRCESSASAARLAAISRSHHASLAKLLGASISTENESIYIAHEFVEGASLSDCLHKKKKKNTNQAFTPLNSWLSRIRLAADIASGVAYMHLQANVVHNRLKSSSVMVIEDGLRGKILHFGSAHIAGDVAINSEREGLGRSRGGARKIDGSRGYLAPEVASGKGSPSKQTDVYALGVVILELISGEEPVSYRSIANGSGLERVSLTETAEKALAKEEVGVRTWVDARLKDSYPVDAALHLTALALRCVATEPEARPEAAMVEGALSRLFLESQAWSERMKRPGDISFSITAR